ncbi:hypothetical protein H5410_008231 [Solanum commersonii]|uniref:Late blight resistance protein n=1 Tax=Solanum commersonii TaxID=4109 RepID=A0A9J6AEC3_SOLCO|nr:hypothetical protein H5410_008231 [Solanum commersonii]
MEGFAFLKLTLVLKSYSVCILVSKNDNIVWMCGHTRRNMIRNEVTQDKVRVASMADMTREARLEWFGHACKEKACGCANKEVRGRGSSKNKQGEVIRHDMTQLQLVEGMTLHRKMWRSKIRVEGYVVVMLPLPYIKDATLHEEIDAYEHQTEPFQEMLAVL